MKDREVNISYMGSSEKLELVAPCKPEEPKSPIPPVKDNFLLNCISSFEPISTAIDDANDKYNDGEFDNHDYEDEGSCYCENFSLKEFLDKNNLTVDDIVITYNFYPCFRHFEDQISLSVKSSDKEKDDKYNLELERYKEDLDYYEKQVELYNSEIERYNLIKAEYDKKLKSYKKELYKLSMKFLKAHFK